MQQLNRNLLIAAALLFALSAFTYHSSVTRADRFERGQTFLPNLNPDEIAKITIGQGDEDTVLQRSGDRFILPSADGYRAKNGAVNRFIRDVLDLTLEKEVGSSDDLAAKLGLGDDAGERIAVSFENAAGQSMVQFQIGDRFEGGSGNYVRRIDGDASPIYLSSKGLYLQTATDDFVERQILDVPKAEIASIRGQGFVFERPEDGGELALADLADGQKASATATQVQTVLAGLRSTEHFLANAPEVQGLVFADRLDVALNDGSRYIVEVAERGDKHYLRVSGDLTEESILAARETLATRDATEDAVRDTSETLERRDEIEDFNAFHGSWIYEVSSTTADKVTAEASDLIEDA
ncbi:MAG: DUF4340 domain-containing protein [Acidobacteriota bacterium]